MPARSAQVRTAFPDEQAPDTLRSYSYLLNHAQVAGLPLQRLVSGALAGMALVWAIGGLPGRWAGALLWLTLALALSIALDRLRRRDFVHFVEVAASTVQPAPLPVSAKIAVYATGLFSVEQKRRRFTLLPGFYRTFATGEHALLCLASDRALLRASAIPVEDRGMWYAFIQPGAIKSLRYGLLHYHRTPMPAVAVEYLVSSVAPGRQSASGATDMIYLVCADPGDTALVLADLQWQATAQSARVSSRT